VLSIGVPMNPMKEALGRASHVLGEAVNEVVLPPEGFFGYEYDLPAVGSLFVLPFDVLEFSLAEVDFLLYFGQELLDGGKDDAAPRNTQHPT
jgi:hypothetical protein